MWTALLASQAIYVGLLVSGAAPLPAAPSVGAVFPIALGVVAAAEAAIAHHFWRRASGAAITLHAPRPDPAVAFYMIAWTIDESIAIYALVLGFLGFPWTTWIWFSLAAALLMIAHRAR